VSATWDEFLSSRDWIITYTGERFRPLANEGVLDWEDIARGLANECRYAGQCRFYSVAEHSIRIAAALEARGHAPEVCRAGLLHDAAEAYLCDIPRPIKHLLPGYKEAENALLSRILTTAGLKPELPAVVHEVDNEILAAENRYIRGSVGVSDSPEPSPDFGHNPSSWGWPPDHAYLTFLMALRAAHFDVREALEKAIRGVK
jgi:hypothetical protein